MTARSVGVAVGAGPLELVLGREDELVIAAVAEVGELPVIEGPLEGLDVFGALADAENHEEVRADETELREDRLAVVFEEAPEVGNEFRRLEEIEWNGMEGAIAPLEG